MRRILFATLMGLLMVTTAFAVDYKSQIGSQDINWGDGTFTRKTSTGSTTTLDKVNDTKIPVSSQSGYYIGDLFHSGHSLHIYPETITGDNTGTLSGYKTVTGPGTGNLSGYDNATFTGRVTTATLTVSGSPTFADNTINGADLIDNTVTSAKILDNSIASGKILDNTIASGKILDNTIALDKIAHTGTASSSTFLRGDASWATYTTTALSSYKNLKVTTPADHASVTITADKVIATDNNDLAIALSTVSLTVNLDVAGANGLDTGSIAANTGYYLWVISNGTTTAGLASTSASVPTMPSGYTYKALVSWCTTDGTGTPFNIEEFTQLDDVYHWTTGQLVYTGNLSTTTLAIDLTATGILGYQAVPANAKEAIVRVRSTTGNYLLSPVTFADSLGDDSAPTWALTYLPGGSVGHMQTNVPLVTAQTLYHQHTSTQATKTYITGFTLKR